MRGYLNRFFEEFAYRPDDAAFLLRAYDTVTAHPEAAACWSEALALYERDIHCDYSRVIALADRAAALTGLYEYTTELLVFVCMTRHTREMYARRGLPEELFHNSLLDLRYKLEECKAVKGIVGSFVAWWFDRFFDLTRFTFGRLQFELIDFGREYRKNGRVLRPDSRVINVHIPRTLTPLDPEACERAYAEAKAFFREEAGDPCAFVCSSWLLFPEHEHLLPGRSNIRRFMARYDCIDAGINKEFSDLWRLFDTDEKHPDKLPADTSLRRAYVEHLRQGGKQGWGCGVFFL